MVTVKEKPIWKFRLSGQAESSTKSKVTSRDVSMII